LLFSCFIKVVVTWIDGSSSSRDVVIALGSRDDCPPAVGGVGAGKVCLGGQRRRHMGFIVVLIVMVSVIDDGVVPDWAMPNIEPLLGLVHARLLPALNPVQFATVEVGPCARLFAGAFGRVGRVAPFGTYARAHETSRMEEPFQPVQISGMQH
jgi:hypothetical protein